jgi:hypothetical protein
MPKEQIIKIINLYLLGYHSTIRGHKKQVAASLATTCMIDG